MLTPLKTTEEKPSGKELIKLGQIFEYKIEVDAEEDEDAPKKNNKVVKKEIYTIKAFFILFNKSYYLLQYDGKDEYAFFAALPGLTYKGKERQGHEPFTKSEILDFLSKRKAYATSEFIYPRVIKKTSYGNKVYSYNNKDTKEVFEVIQKKNNAAEAW